MSKYCYVYVLRSQVDRQFYVGLTRDLPTRVRAHNDGRVDSTKKRWPFELVYWEGCRNESDAAQREKYLKTAWGKRYIKNRLRRLRSLSDSAGAKAPENVLLFEKSAAQNAALLVTGIVGRLEAQ